MQPGDRLICAFVEGMHIQETFQIWPLHVTILPWFRLADRSDDIAHGLETALHTMHSFEAVMDEQTVIGPRQSRPATLIQLPTPFSEIEHRVRNYFHKKRAWLVDETTKVRREFRPHVTVQGSKDMHTGDTFICDRVYIVEQKGDYKEIVREILLGI